MAAPSPASPSGTEPNLWSWKLLRAGRFLLDGGGMFGVIPRVVWSRAVEVDEANRVELSHNCLLLSRTTADGTAQHVLVEAGTGEKLDAKMSAIFGLEGRTIEHAITEAGVQPDDIDATIVTHLHFDHAGGLTRRVRIGETPHWNAENPRDASGDSVSVRRTFPNAELIVQRREWNDAIANDAVMTRTYYRDHLLPMQNNVRLIDSPEPFPAGTIPHRDDLPETTIEARWTEVFPGIRVFRVPGHTWGQQAVMIDATDGNTLVFAADLLPTRHHIGAAYSLSYDVEPYTAMVTKRWFLTEAAKRDWLLVLDHDPGTALHRVRANDKGWFDLTEA